MLSGEYFLTQDEIKQKEWEKKHEKKEVKKQERVDNQLK